MGTAPMFEATLPPNCCVPVAPKLFVAPVLNRLIPNWLSFARSTWAKRTLSKICFRLPGSAMRIELTMSLEKGAAILPICSATAWLDTVPVTTTRSSSASAVTDSPGKLREIASRSNDTSTSANTSRIRDWLFSCHNTTLLLPGVVAVTTSSLGAVVAVVTTLGLPTSTRLKRASVRITTEWPTRMCRTWFAPAVSRDSVCGTGTAAAAVAAIAEAEGIVQPGAISAISDSSRARACNCRNCLLHYSGVAGNLAIVTLFPIKVSTM